MRIVLTAIVGSDGRAFAQLPVEAGTDPVKPPAMACYLSDLVEPVAWLVVAFSSSTSFPSCGLAFSNGSFRAAMIDAPVGWTAAFVVVY